jgi:hypothetical protein
MYQRVIWKMALGAAAVLGLMLVYVDFALPPLCRWAEKVTP